MHAQTLKLRVYDACMHAPSLKASLTPPLTPEMYKTTDCISTFDYIQTEYINMELKQVIKKERKKKKKKKEKKKKEKNPRDK